MIITRNAKGSPLTHAELDNNFTELQTALTQKANSTDLFTKSESNTNFAAKSGSNTQAFAVAAATTPEQAVRKSQLDATEKVHRYNNFVVSGTANDITLTLQGDRVGVTTIEDGVEVNFVAALDNTGPVVVTVDFITEQLVDIPVTKLGAVPLASGDIVQGAAYKLFWDGTGFQLFSGTGGGTGTVDLSNYYTKAEVDAEMAKNRIPVGFVMTYPTLSIPTGYIKCNSQYLLIADFPDLYDVIGHTYDDVFNPDPLLYFRVPELRGEFIRGADDGRFVDTSPVKGKLTNGSNVITSFDSLGNGYGIGLRISGSGIPAGTTITGFDIYAGTVTMSAAATTTTSVAVNLTITGRIIGTAQTDTLQDHNHDYTRSYDGPIQGDGNFNRILNFTSDTTSGAKNARVGGETRGRNVAMCYCIKAFDTITLPAEVAWEASINARIAEIFNNFDLSPKGHYKFPGGLIVQWGSGSYANNASETFDIPFLNQVLAISITPNSSSTSYVEHMSYKNTTLTGFDVTALHFNSNWVSSTISGSWIAIGH